MICTCIIINSEANTGAELFTAMVSNGEARFCI